jgi:hypothetical protein
VKNYVSVFNTFFFRWKKCHSEPVIATLGHQIVIQFLGNKCMLGLNIEFPGHGEGSIGWKALLDNPEGMFKTDKDGCPYSGKKPEI